MLASLPFVTFSTGGNVHVMLNLRLTDAALVVLRADALPGYPALQPPAVACYLALPHPLRLEISP